MTRMSNKLVLANMKSAQLMELKKINQSVMNEVIKILTPHAPVKLCILIMNKPVNL